MEHLGSNPSNALIARLGRIQQVVSDLNLRFGSRQGSEPVASASAQYDAEVRELREQLELMQAWAQDSEDKLRIAGQQLQRALLSEEQRQRECVELRALVRQQEERLRTREAESQALQAQLAAQQEVQASLDLQIGELEQALKNARQTVAEQGDLLRESESREAQLKRRLRDFKRAG